MRLTMTAAAAAMAFAFSAPGLSAEIYKDYVPSKDVYNVTFVRVNPNRLDDYLDGLRQTWWNSCQIQKKLGDTIDCAIYQSETMANRDFNLILVIHQSGAGLSDPDEKRYNALMAELRKQLAEDKEKKLVEGYDTLRTFFGEQTFRALTFK